MICREFYTLSILSCIMPFGFMNLQLWWKYLASVQNLSLCYFVLRFMVSLSNVVLVVFRC
jgi:hypothetical protein